MGWKRSQTKNRGLILKEGAAEKRFGKKRMVCFGGCAPLPIRTVHGPRTHSQLSRNTRRQRFMNPSYFITNRCCRAPLCNFHRMPRPPFAQNCRGWRDEVTYESIGSMALGTSEITSGSFLSCAATAKDSDRKYAQFAMS